MTIMEMTMKYKITDHELKDMRARLIRYSTNPAFSDGFRHSCRRCAGLIRKHLAGEGDDAELVYAVEDFFGRQAWVEIARFHNEAGMVQ